MSIALPLKGSQIVAMDLIRRSMGLINAVAAGEIPSDADLNDGLITLNEMIDSWNLQSLAVYATANEQWDLVPGKATYQWGVGASLPDFTTARPVEINNVTCVRNGFTTPVLIINQVEYDSISLKSTSQPLVERLLYVNDYPLGLVTLYPVPSEVVTLSIDSLNALTGPVSLQTVLAFPPGYLRALRYNLAVELWPEYTNTTTDMASIKKIAADSFGEIKKSNMVQPVTTFESIPGVQTGRDWDWRGGV